MGIYTYANKKFIVIFLFNYPCHVLQPFFLFRAFTIYFNTIPLRRQSLVQLGHLCMVIRNDGQSNSYIQLDRTRWKSEAAISKEYKQSNHNLSNSGKVNPPDGLILLK